MARAVGIDLGTTNSVVAYADTRDESRAGGSFTIVGIGASLVRLSVGVEDPAAGRLHDGEVGIGADADRPLPWIEAEDAGRRGRKQVDELPEPARDFVRAIEDAIRPATRAGRSCNPRLRSKLAQRSAI